LIRREIREHLPAGAVELLFSGCECVVEGSAELMGKDASRRGSTARRVYVTVMVTIDLQSSAPLFREPADAATAERVAELMVVDARVRDKLCGLARPKLAELAGLAPADLEIALDATARAEGTKILIDGDAMGSPHARGEG
jgi:hypothetical protein